MSRRFLALFAIIWAPLLLWWAALLPGGISNDTLDSWTQIKSEDVPKVNASIKAADLPAITVSTTAPAATASPSIAPASRDSTVPSLSPPRQLEATPATPAPTAHIPPESTGQTMTADGFSLPTESTEETPAAPSSPSASPPN